MTEQHVHEWHESDTRRKCLICGLVVRTATGQKLRSALAVIRELDRLLAREQPLYAGRKRVLLSARLGAA